MTGRLALIARREVRRSNLLYKESSESLSFLKVASIGFVGQLP